MRKINFALVIIVNKGNPNGDPLAGNQPRRDINGYGEISDVCIKRKIRNRLQDFGENILITSKERTYDGLYSIAARVKAQKDLKEYGKKGDLINFEKEACRLWADVRFFGQVFAFKDKDTGNVSVGIRGPVSIGLAKSLDVITIEGMQITKSINADDPQKGKRETDRDSSTMGMKYLVDHGAYVAYGTIFPELARKTGFDEKDVELLKNALITIFENDASSTRPTGSMESKLYWWEPTSDKVNVSPPKVFRSLNIKPADEYPYYTCNPEEIEGLKLEIYE